MEQKQRISAFVQLGEKLSQFLQKPTIFDVEDNDFKPLANACLRSSQKNGWFTEDEIRRAIQGIVFLLESEKLESWTKSYDFSSTAAKTIATIFAGNIPAVGFHDWLSVLISGNKVLAKLSSQDEYLIPAFSDILIEIEPRFSDFIEFAKTKMENIDAFIGTGSNNSARYFKYYFGKYPHIIRKNRSSVAIVKNDISKEDLSEMGKDLFYYYGLGCRNVTKIYFEKGFQLNRFFEAIIDFGYVIDNNKYGNNYIYNKTLFLMNSEKILDNNFVILRPGPELNSQVGVINYEFFENEDNLRSELKSQETQIQAIISTKDIGFGKAQTPYLTDYADGINTLNFLANLAHH